jgi:hypothetical protein
LGVLAFCNHPVCARRLAGSSTGSLQCSSKPGALRATGGRRGAEGSMTGRWVSPSQRRQNWTRQPACRGKVPRLRVPGGFLRGSPHRRGAKVGPGVHVTFHGLRRANDTDDPGTRSTKRRGIPSGIAPCAVPRLPPGTSGGPAPRGFLCSVLRPLCSHVGSCASFTGAFAAYTSATRQLVPTVRQASQTTSQASRRSCPGLDSANAVTTTKVGVRARQSSGRRSRPPSFEGDSSFGYARKPKYVAAV